MMQRAILIDLIYLLLLCGAIWGVFMFLPIASQENFSVISVENEQKLGATIMDKLIHGNPDYSMVEDTLVSGAMDRIKQRLEAGMEERKFEYHIFVYKSEEINGYALPGGIILLTTGLLKFVEEPEEIAVVIAHEMGHVEERHVIKRMAKEIGVSVLFSGDNMLLGRVARLATSTAYDRKQEERADDFALCLLEKVRINPQAMALFFERLADTYESWGDYLPFLMTHPETVSRAEKAGKYQVEEGFIQDSLPLNWSAVQQVLQEI